MTTKPESPDSGAGATIRPGTIRRLNYIAWMKDIGGCEPPEEWKEAYTAGYEQKVHDTSAQDSGQGEAVAIGQVVASKSRGIETEWYNYLPRPGTKLFSHPPKPAQDAAGKGVAKEHHIALLESMSDDDWEYLFLVRPDLKVRLKAVFDAAKPAQVGEKYRPFTLDEAAWIAEKFMSCEMKPDDHAEMLALLNKRGAVVPAQDGGV